MIDDTKATQIRENLKLDEKAFLGETPKGDYTVVKVSEDPVKIGDNSVWYPVDVKNVDTKEVHQMSLKGLLTAKGLEYSTRDMNSRIKMWFALAEGKARKFTYEGKETKIVTLKNRDSLTIDGKTYNKGDEMPLKLYTFKAFKVG